MIGKLSGIVSFVGERYLILDVAGVGYKIFAPPDVLREANKKRAGVSLFTHLAVREDALDLYGFLSQSELQFFELLLTVSGIGPKSALSVVSVAPIENLKKAIASGDTSYLTKVSGIGRKTSAKIILELRDRLGSGIDVSVPELKEESDAIEALRSLGYTQTEAREAMREAPHQGKTSDRVKEALRFLNKNNK